MRAKALLLAAGLGTRLKPITDRIPKCLVPIAGRPALDYWAESLREAGIDKALVNTHSHTASVREYLNDLNFLGGLAVHETYEETLLGSAGTITANPGVAEDADCVVVIYADNLSDLDLALLIEFHRGHPDPGTMMLFRTPEPKSCGIAELDSANRIVSFAEKPDDPVSDLANGGVYVFDSALYSEIAAMGAFDLGFDVLPKLLGRMRGYPWPGQHLDFGTPDRLRKAQSVGRELSTRRGFDVENRRPGVFVDTRSIDDLHATVPVLRELRSLGVAVVATAFHEVEETGFVFDAVADTAEMLEGICRVLRIRRGACWLVSGSESCRDSFPSGFLTGMFPFDPDRVVEHVRSALRRPSPKAEGVQE